MVWNRAGFPIVNALLQIRCTLSAETAILSDTLLRKDKLTETIMSVCNLYIRQTLYQSISIRPIESYRNVTEQTI